MKEVLPIDEDPDVEQMKTWEIELNHDDYRTTLIINARDENTARSLIMEIERCPARSILSIREVWHEDNTGSYVIQI